MRSGSLNPVPDEEAAYSKLIELLAAAGRLFNEHRACTIVRHIDSVIPVDKKGLQSLELSVHKLCKALNAISLDTLCSYKTKNSIFPVLI